MPRDIDLQDEQQVALVRNLDLSTPEPGRWVPSNGMYDAADAAVLRAVLLHFRPKKLVEVGSGYSTALTLDVADTDLPGLAITCIEPYPDRLRSRLRTGDTDRLTLLEQQVQDIRPEDLAAMVGAGDVFFIDSTHVVKPGSDVTWLILHTLPLLPIGSIVHVHDVFWPFEYPTNWLEQGRNWTELYLLQAFLMNNQSWRLVLFSSYMWEKHPNLIPAALAGMKPGSMWLIREQ